jgi:cohesin loading factor subunit SCC2
LLTTQLDPGFTLFIADNLVTLDYKLQDEVILVVQQLSIVVSTCTPLVIILEKARIVGQESDSIEGKTLVIDDVSSSRDCLADAQPDGDGGKADRMIHASIMVCLALLTKNHLLRAFGLSEE